MDKDDKTAVFWCAEQGNVEALEVRLSAVFVFFAHNQNTFMTLKVLILRQEQVTFSSLESSHLNVSLRFS